jgi:hypothetical protein
MHLIFLSLFKLGKYEHETEQIKRTDNRNKSLKAFRDGRIFRYVADVVEEVNTPAKSNKA